MRQVKRIIRDIPELVGELRALKARCRDFVVPEGKIHFGTDEGELTIGFMERAYRIEAQAHEQLAEKYGIPKRYYDRCLSAKEAKLLAQNLDVWIGREGTGKRLVRLIDDRVRGYLSDKYKPLSHLDLLTTAVQVVTGQDAEKGGYAKGATCLGWTLDPRYLDVALINPGIQIDLKNPDKVHFERPGGYSPDAPNHGWIRPGTGTGGEHWVFPAAFLKNSETGYGRWGVRVGLYEAICDNTVRTGRDLAVTHLGKAIEEGEVTFSEATHEKENAAIFAKASDIIRSAFDPASLLALVRKMKGLADEKIEDVREVAGEIAKLPGLTEEVRDDILAAYRSLAQDKDTLLDVQRAVTAAAHVYRETKPEIAETLELIGGDIIERGERAFAVKRS